MAYTKQNFEDGQTLKAEHLNKMEEGIAAPDWDQMVNRPFGYWPTGSDTLCWNGKTEGLDCFNGMMYKVSDSVPILDDFKNGFTITIGGGSVDLPAECAALVDGAIVIAMEEPTNPDSMPLVCIVDESNAAEKGVGAGVYFLYLDMTELGGTLLITERLTIPGYTKFAFTKLINEEYIPDSVKNHTTVFYADSDSYLYPSADTSDTTKRITKAQLLEYFNLGYPMWIVAPNLTQYFGVVTIDCLASRSFGMVLAINGAMTPYYTAEYTAS